jgi:hypothetical protein
MKTIIVASLGLNAVLLGALALISVRQPAPTKNPAEGAPPPEPVQSVPRRERPQPKSTAIANLASFQWSQLESSDYHQYMANLRSIGCPDETIRDLIIAEVDKMFDPRFAALAAETQKFEHWRNRSKRSDTLLTQLRALHDERKALLRELLGIDAAPYAKWANADVERLREEGKYSFLPADKQAQVRAIMEKYQQSIDGGQNGRDGFTLNGGDDAKRLREQRQQELAQVLSPEELKEMSLRDSNAADSVRNRFGNLDISEDEYRKLYDLRKSYEDKVGAVADNSDPEKMRQRSEARRELDEAYRNVFGEERWNDLQKQQDPTWRGLTQVAQQNNLSQSVIDQAYQYQRQTGDEVMRLMEDRSLTREQREGVIQQLTGEYDQKLRGLLGEQPFQQYKQTNPGFSFTRGGDSFSFVAPAGFPVPVGGGPRTIDVQRGGPDVRTRIQINP